MTPQSASLPDDEGDGCVEVGVEGDADEEEETIVARVVGAGDDGAGRVTSAFTFTALATSSFSETVLDGVAAGVDGVDGGSGADELGAGAGAGAGDGDGAGLPPEGEEPPLHRSASAVE